MQIHELNDFTGALGANSFLVVDNGSDTGKVSTQQILAGTEARIDNIIAGDAPSAAEVTDARLGADGMTYTSLGTAIRTQISNIEADVGNLSHLGVLKFNASNFINGDFNNSGAILVNYKYRVANLNLMTFPYEIKIKIADGYAIYLFFFENGSYSSNVNNIFGEYTVPANQQFRVFIRANPEDSSIVANINTFVNALSIETVVSDVQTKVSMLPCKAQTPPLFEGGILASSGQVYHDSNETWMKTRVRTNVVYVAKDSIIQTTSALYRLTVCRYADYELSNYVEAILNQSSTKSWKCAQDGYYTITFDLASGNALDIATVKSAFDFSSFYCQRDERIHISWIGSGISAETSTYTDSGDCAMVVFPNGEGLLIDSANSRNYGSLRKRIADAGFYHIKNIIISHFHADHIGGLLTMVNDNLINIDGATVYLPDYDATLWAYNNNVMESATKTLYDNAMTMFSNKNCTLVYPDTDFKPYEIGGAILSFFNTDMSIYEGVSTNYNDWSLCNYIFYGDMNICFSSDLGPISQAELGGSLYKANIYKADHHGWLNQTVMPLAYINNVSPDVIIAMDGAVHDEYIVTDTAPLVRWADKNGVPYYRKYTNGEIKMAVSKESWMFESQVSRFALPNS